MQVLMSLNSSSPVWLVCEQANCHMATILGAVVAPSNPPQTLKIVWVSPSSSPINALPFALPLSSTPPSPHTLPLFRNPPLDTTMAPHPSLTAPTPLVFIATVLFVVIVMAGFTFQRSSCHQMASDSKSSIIFDVVHIQGCRIQQQLPSISMGRVWGQLRWGLQINSGL